jgi:hypothetical protein
MLIRNRRGHWHAAAVVLDFSVFGRTGRGAKPLA